MYAVVGCSECRALWLLADPRSAETATCPRCRRRHRTADLKRLYTAEDRDAAREARASLLAERADAADAFEATPAAGEDPGSVVDDREYLDAAGVDPEAVEAAGERAGAGDTGSRSRPEIVREAVRTLDTPDEGDVVAYAADRGVPADAASDLLDRLVRRGEASESGGTYRLL
ncbi:replication protein H [Haloplanus rallus]|jgi:hypothetical protein|uniref:Replication protein H n=1 Tax=Haloplanus rallus TaxID=1816183 RepID=A0A6B9FA26_9EURY|nr:MULTISPECIES: DUF5817 domain-containing protein [Haloplanus]QGX95131.1 replication protein H [Haloplanus rallus]